LLNLSIENGIIYIITNSEEGWVEWFVENFYPSVIPLLNKIKIISARSLYEKKYPGNMKKWKMQSFLDLQLKFESDLNLISVGDSEHEIDACVLLASRLNCISKTVKLKSDPKFEDLIRQLNLILDRFMYIVNSRKSVTISVEQE
jgi:hypothetical protein